MLRRIDSPSRPSHLVELLGQRAERDPDRLAYTSFAVRRSGELEEVAVSYRQLHRAAAGLAARLGELHAAGERALLLFPQTHPQTLDFIAAFFGCLWAGVIAIPSYPAEFHDTEERRNEGILRDAGAKFIITTAEVQQRLAGKLPAGAGVQWILADGLATGPSHAEEPPVACHEVAYIQYTSGTSPNGRSSITWLKYWIACICRTAPRSSLTGRNRVLFHDSETKNIIFPVFAPKYSLSKRETVLFSRGLYPRTFSPNGRLYFCFVRTAPAHILIHRGLL